MSVAPGVQTQDGKATSKEDYSSSIAKNSSGDKTARDIVAQKNEISVILEHVQPLVKGDTRYLMDINWFKQWEKYVGFKIWDQKRMGNESAYPGPINTSALFKDIEQGVLNSNLMQDRDYCFIPEEAWEKFVTWYGVETSSKPIPRHVVEFGLYVKHLRVEVYLVELRLALYPNTNSFQTKMFSRADTVGDVMKVMKQLYSVPEEKECHVWRVKWMCSTYDLLSKLDESIQDAELYTNQLLLLELGNEDGTWSQSFSSCTGPGAAVVPISSDNKITTSDHSTSLQSREKVEFGVCGLGNLGNSAYMNAPVQCLSNAQPLTEYILRDDFVSNINEKSKTGSGGIVTRVYADLLHEMWSGNTSCAHPHLLKEAMGEIFPDFANYKPNNAFDFSLLLLDTLHRDLNCAGQNYQPFPDDDNRADKVVAEKFWKIHLNRNKSIADQLFHWQLKRSLTCYDCKECGVHSGLPQLLNLLKSQLSYCSEEVYKNFNVCTCVELPVPPIKLKEIIVMIKVVRADPTQPITMVKVTIPEHGRISTVINKVSLQTGISSNKIMVINVCNYRFGKIFDVAEEFNYLTDRDNLYCYELPNTSTQNPDLIVIPVYNRVFCSERHTYDLNTCRQLFAVPQLVAVPRNNLTYKILYKLLLSHMSNYMKDSSPVKADIQNNSFGSNVREANKDETVVSKPVDYFTLNIVSKEGSIVLQELHDDDTSLKFDNNTYVACDWDPYWRKECFDVDKVEDYFNIKYTSDMEKISLLDCVKQWTAVEERILDFDLWHCPTCKKYRKCSSKFDIWTLPEVLVIRLKKWTVSDLKAKKLYTMVEFPIYGLDLSNYVINPDASKPVYNLFGVVNHYGGGTYGHYTAYAKNYLTGKWYHFDDSNVYEVDEDEVVSSAACILFYVQTKEK